MNERQFTTQQMLSMLTEGPPRIAQLTTEMTPAQLRTGPGEGEWSANDVLAHIRSCADVWGDCIRAMIAEDGITFKAVNPTTWIKKTDYPDLEFRPSLQVFTAQRAELLEVLRALAPKLWAHKATVKGAGKPMERTVLFYAQWMARHERSHIKQIASIAKALANR